MIRLCPGSSLTVTGGKDLRPEVAGVAGNERWEGEVVVHEPVATAEWGEGETEDALTGGWGSNRMRFTPDEDDEESV
jgi:hypothetical protein